MIKLNLKNNFKIIRLYAIGLICIGSYFLMENSILISEFVTKSSEFRYNGFVTFLLTGLLKYGILSIGLIIIIMLTYLLIRNRITSY